MDNAKWRNFTKADYETLNTAVKDGTYTINGDNEAKIDDLGLKAVTVTLVED
jgi:hypothetical protein